MDVETSQNKTNVVGENDFTLANLLINRNLNEFNTGSNFKYPNVNMGDGFYLY